MMELGGFRMTTEQLEARVSDLEKELAALRREVATLRPTGKSGWLQTVAGSFADDPEFAETIRIGRYYNDNGRLPDEYEDGPTI
jgi:hypothetical protein